MNKENDLKKISLLYNSDKVEHGYIDIYHEYFKKIKDEKKINNIEKELNLLLPNLDKIGINIKDVLFKKLKKVNLKLWDVEDNLRKLESQGKFDDEFIEMARQVYYTNDLRAKIKREININTGSKL